MDAITLAGDGTQYLSDDGTYKSLSSGGAMSDYLLKKSIDNQGNINILSEDAVMQTEQQISLMVQDEDGNMSHILMGPQYVGINLDGMSVAVSPNSFQANGRDVIAAGEGDGTKFLADDGTYKEVSGGSDLPTGTNNQFLYNSSGTPVWQSPMTLANINARETVGRTIPASILAANFLRGSVYYSGTSVASQYPSSSITMYPGYNYLFHSYGFGAINGLSQEDNSFNGAFIEILDSGSSIPKGAELYFKGEPSAEEGKVPDGVIDIEFSDNTRFTIDESEVSIYDNKTGIYTSLYNFQSGSSEQTYIFPESVTIVNQNFGTSDPYYWMSFATLMYSSGNIIVGNQSTKTKISSKGIPIANVLNSDDTQSERPLLVDISIEEQFTGRYNLDGKKIYQKTINCGTLPNNTIKNVAHGISNLYRVLRVEGYTYNSSTQVTLPIPYSATTTNDLLAVTTDNTNVIIVTNANKSAYTETYVTLYYTCADR